MSATTTDDGANPVAGLAIAGLSGLLFGFGLYFSQMVDPLKVLRFLDIGAMPVGLWDPSLAVVIVSAIGVMMVGVQLAKRRSRPLFDTHFHGPERTGFDWPLISGGVLFGVGWGLSGICPGPAITLIGFNPENLWAFLLPMFLGSYLGHYILEWTGNRKLQAA